MTEEQHDLAMAAMKANFARLVDSLVVTIGLAAEIHPAEMRAALAKIFDVTAVDDRTKRAVLVASHARTSRPPRRWH
jgi:hypothetical protein